jgi:hypothetical protein
MGEPSWEIKLYNQCGGSQVEVGECCRGCACTRDAPIKPPQKAGATALGNSVWQEQCDPDFSTDFITASNITIGNDAG